MESGGEEQLWQAPMSQLGAEPGFREVTERKGDTLNGGLDQLE